MNNVLNVIFHGRETKASNLWQYDYGQKLKFYGLNLPDAYEVHFANTESGESITMLGDADGVDIPDALLQTGKNIYVWVYLHTGEDDGETEYKAVIPVKTRAKPTNTEPTPVQQDVITQTIAALNAGVSEVEEIADSIPDTINEALEAAKESGEFDGPKGDPGEQGQKGDPGQNGVSPTVTVTDITGGHRVSITDANGTQTFDVMNGEPGEKGDNGFSPVVTVTEIAGGHRVSITDASGTQTFDVMDGTGGGGGTSNYDDLSNKPQIGGVTLSGNKSASDLGLVAAEPGKGLSSNDFTSSEKNKLSRIPEGAEVNVQSDWNQSDSSADDFIKNKPSIPAAVTVDSALSDASENPVQNKVIKSALDGKGTYSKPSGGIPKTDLDSGVQASLENADSALQSVPSTYRTSAAQDVIDATKITAPSSPATGAFLMFDGDEWVAQTLATWQGGSY